MWHKQPVASLQLRSNRLVLPLPLIWSGRSWLPMCSDKRRTNAKEPTMPSIISKPARQERHCEPCEHLARENKLCSSLHGISCDYVCHHPEAHAWSELPTDPTEAQLMTRLRANMEKHGRMIGRCSQQPDWCPLLREPLP